MKGGHGIETAAERATHWESGIEIYTISPLNNEDSEHSGDNHSSFSKTKKTFVYIILCTVFYVLTLQIFTDRNFVDKCSQQVMHFDHEATY